MANELKHYDIIIVGGGLVGMAAAINLARFDLSICLLESVEAQNNFHPSYDDRTLVVNHASINFWTNCGIWHDLKPSLTAINKVHVSNKGHFGSVTFDKDELKIEALAYILEAKVLGMALKSKLSSFKNITVTCPALVTDFETKADKVNINYKLNDKLHSVSTKLMLAADGVNSSIRKQLKLETQIKSYQRTAIICNITPQEKHNNCAYERLSTKGPTALLPFVNNRCGFVWTVEEDQAKEILSLTDDEFITKAQQQFGYRLGKFVKVGQRSSYPLYFIKVPKQTKSRVILIGNAAHAMSPVSAQGLNLAVRDVAHLVEVIKHNLMENKDIGADACLNNYQKNVDEDQNQTMNYTDDLMNWFKIDEPFVAAIRSAGLFTLNQSTQLKAKLFARASGFRGDTPALLRKIS